MGLIGLHLEDNLVIWWRMFTFLKLFKVNIILHQRIVDILYNKK